MNIKSSLKKYRILGEYFLPDYNRENDVLIEFKDKNSSLTKQQTNELITILQSDREMPDKFFVADLLYLYKNFDEELIEPLIHNAINFKDPSFNRIFLRPCLRNIGVKQVSEILADIFSKAGIVERIGISNLLYWMNVEENGDTSPLLQVIEKQSYQTSNLIELYHYKFYLKDKIKNFDKIPNHATELIDVIRGNKEYEELLFNQLEWKS